MHLCFDFSSRPWFSTEQICEMPGCLPHLSLDFSSRPWFSTGKFVKCKVPYRISALTFLVVHGFLPPAVKKKKKCSNQIFRIEVFESKFSKFSKRSKLLQTPGICKTSKPFKNLKLPLRNGNGIRISRMLKQLKIIRTHFSTKFVVKVVKNS